MIWGEHPYFWKHPFFCATSMAYYCIFLREMQLYHTPSNQFYRIICFHPCVYIINSLSFSKVFHPFVFLYKECCLQIVDPGTTEIEELRLKIACSHLRNQGIKMDRVGFGYESGDKGMQL